jgi:hypothetical protein
MEIEYDELDEERIPWHPAFVEALQMELQEYQDVLEFHPEYQLTSEPLRIDCVVIKKAKDVVIKKNIAVIFREWNLLEYKSPDDYISVTDFYKVYGYACLYASFNKVPITSLTVSFIESHYPHKLLDHLKTERHYSVAETAPGIYTINGDILPIQIIDSRRLSADENLWLKNLSKELGYMAITQVGKEIDRQGKAARLAAYWNAIMHANPAAIQEAIEMKRISRLDRVFIETGWAAAWEAEGRAEGEARGEQRVFGIAQNMVKLGLPIETVISATQLDPEKVKPLYQA